MMFNYPFLGFRNPYRYYSPAIYKNRYRPNYNMYYSKTENEPLKKENLIVNNKENSDDRTINKNEQFFSILGIKLYFDDLIILALLYFLYTEGVKDEGLFISLILLLLS